MDPSCVQDRFIKHKAGISSQHLPCAVRLKCREWVFFTFHGHNVFPFQRDFHGFSRLCNLTLGGIGKIILFLKQLNYKYCLGYESIPAFCCFSKIVKVVNSRDVLLVFN